MAQSLKHHQKKQIQDNEENETEAARAADFFSEDPTLWKSRRKIFASKACWIRGDCGSSFDPWQGDCLQAHRFKGYSWFF